jgi:anthranilate phosphoribosyltransferase
VHGNLPIERYLLDGTALGLTRAANTALAGGDTIENVTIARAILGGQGTIAQHDVVVFNAAAAIRAADMHQSWQQAIERARASIASGAAQQRLTQAIS